MRLQLPTDRLILEELQNGRNLAANISAAIDRHRKTVNSRLSQLEDYDLVQNVGGGLYELTERGGAALQVIDQYPDTDDFDQLVDDQIDSVRISPFRIEKLEPNEDTTRSTE